MTKKTTAGVLEQPRDFQFHEIPIPDIGPEEGILRVEACGLCSTDYEQWRGHLRDWAAALPSTQGQSSVDHQVMAGNVIGVVRR
jgi:alcohol dehydrogenase